jgi:hypothetical protein
VATTLVAIRAEVNGKNCIDRRLGEIVAQKDRITENNQVFWQRMSALRTENIQLKSDLATAQKEITAILEGRDTPKTSAPPLALSNSEPPIEELGRL